MNIQDDDSTAPLSRPAVLPARAPRACIVEKPHLAQFLSQTLEEIGLVTFECGKEPGIRAALAAHRPDIFVIGNLLEGIAAMAALDDLSKAGFDGHVLLIGPSAAPLTGTIQSLGSELGLNMLPLLATPFTQAALQSSVCGIVARDTAAQAPIELAEALDSDWLDLWYQPKLQMRSFSLAGAEALIRLRHPHLGILQPAQFLPGATEDELVALSQFVISRAVSDWRWFYANHGTVGIAINLPMIFLQRQSLIDDLTHRFPAHPAFEGFVVETNAAELIGNFEFARTVSDRLRAVNVSLSIDDVAEEWTALVELSDFPFAELKVDRSLVDGCADDSKKRAACRRIVAFAESVGARTVAEGVETRSDFVAALEIGFDTVQGYFVGKPMERGKFLSRALQRPLGLPGMHN